MTVYEEFTANPEFAAAVSSAYTGRHEIADAVWWLDHPELPGPSGAVSPADGRDELERAAYSRAGATDPAWADALQRLDAELEQDRENTLAAVASARMPAPVEETEPVEPVRRRGWVLPVVAVVALLLGLVVGFQVGASSDSTVIEHGGAYESATNRPTQQFSGTAVFDRVEESADTPTARLPSSFNGSVFRVLNVGSTASRLPYVYAARTPSGQLCLIVVVDSVDPESVADDGIVPRASFSCAIETEFPASGLQVGWRSEDDQGAVSWDESGGVMMSNR